jgi:hypothetical protein
MKSYLITTAYKVLKHARIWVLMLVVFTLLIMALEILTGNHDQFRSVGNFNF